VASVGVFTTFLLSVAVAVTVVVQSKVWHNAKQGKAR